MAEAQDGALDALGPFLTANNREPEFADFICDQSVKHPYQYAPYCTDARSGWRQQVCACIDDANRKGVHHDDCL